MLLIDWGTFIGYAIPSILGFGVRICQERKKRTPASFILQLMASIFISYNAYYLFPYVKDFRMLGVGPFKEIHVFISTSSYFGSYFVTQIDRMVKLGWKQWLRDRATEFLAYTDKEKKSKS